MCFVVGRIIRIGYVEKLANMAEEVHVVLRKNEHNGFGFSLLAKPGLPPIIYNIVDDSPAADSGEVEVGDAILKINETDVNRLSTKEVLKCLRLSSDPVTLKIKRDPKIKATVRNHLLSLNAAPETTGAAVAATTRPKRDSPPRPRTPLTNRPRPEPIVHQSHVRTNGSCPSPHHSEQERLLLKQQHHRPHHYHHHDNNSDEDNNDEDNNQHNAKKPLLWEPLTTNNDDDRNSSKYKQQQKQQPQQQPKFEAFMMTGEHILNISRMPRTSSIVPKQQKKIDSSRYHNSHTYHLHDQHNSVPNSPNELDLGFKNNYRTNSNSVNTSPVCSNKWDGLPSPRDGADSSSKSTYSSNYVRTSRSEDQLQGQDEFCGMSTVDIDVDEDITSSLNTLLDTRLECSGGGSVVAGSVSDRIIWTYNAPVSADRHKPFCQQTVSNGSGSSSSSQSNSSPTSSSFSPLHSGSPASPTSVSSSVMSSSQSGSRGKVVVPSGGGGGATSAATHTQMMVLNGGGDLSVSEAISNISSPDYHDDDSVGIRDCVMEISDHSDSDSTLLVSEPRRHHHGTHSDDSERDHRIVIQVRGPEREHHGKGLCCDGLLKTIADYQLQTSSDLTEICYDSEEPTTLLHDLERTSPQSSEDDSDVDSLHSFHYSPKAVDIPSAIRLAKRLYSLDGFKKSDVSRHLSKNNDFTKAVAEEYLKYFTFETDTLDIALRKFLKQFCLTGETQERERVLVHFSKRYLDCNPGSFNSQDAVHTLTCAIMLLNTDLHGQNINRKMTCNEFVENLAGLNESENFPREVLKQLYHAIKNYPLEWALDEDVDDNVAQISKKKMDHINLGGNPFLDMPISSNATEYKKGYVMRKCCYEANAKRTPFHKRNWKMFYCTIRDLVLYLHKDENGFRKNQMGGDNLHNAIRIHHALATKASDYTKKQYVFRLQTADQAEYLFQTSDSKELQSWIDTINFVCATFSASPLEAAVGSQKKFQRPLLPCSHTKLNLREQLRDHEERVMRLEAELDDHKKSPPEKNSKSLVVQNYKEKEAYLVHEIKRYGTYAYMLRSRIAQHTTDLGAISLVENSIGEDDEATGFALTDGSSNLLAAPPLHQVAVPNRSSPSTNRRSPE